MNYIDQDSLTNCTHIIFCSWVDCHWLLIKRFYLAINNFLTICVFIHYSDADKQPWNFHLCCQSSERCNNFVVNLSNMTGSAFIFPIIWKSFFFPLLSLLDNSFMSYRTFSFFVLLNILRQQLILLSYLRFSFQYYAIISTFMTVKDLIIVQFIYLT